MTQPAGRLFLSPPHMSGAEARFTVEAFASNYIAPLGPMVDAFEQEFSRYTGIPHCLAVSSGTAAMHLALRHRLSPPPQAADAAGRRPLVIASTLTFIGSVTPATFEGCELRFIDSDAASWNMDPALLESELDQCARAGERPAAVVPTDLYGQCCDLRRIVAACERHGVPVICDSAEAVGARYATVARAAPGAPTRHAGYDAWAAVYSFNGNKIITTSGGGMLASHDPALIEHARKLSTQARDPAPHYEHSEIGFNYRMSNIAAAIGRGQLQVLDERVAQKRRIFELYREQLAGQPGITLMPEAPGVVCNRWLTVVVIDAAEFGCDASAVRAALERENIEARPVWKPMHLQPVFRECRTRSVVGGVESGPEAERRMARGVRSVSESLFEAGLCLPSGTAMTGADVHRVCELIRCAASAAPAAGRRR